MRSYVTTSGLKNSSIYSSPRQLWIGLLLIAVFWPLNWTLPGLRSAFLFFPLWLGYILVIDGLVLTRSATSMLQRSGRDFALLFVCSAPAWWLFEVINWRTKNWEYLGGDKFTGLQYFFLSSLSFSTVMPAVFETAELVRTFGWIGKLQSGPRIKSTRMVCFIFLGVGLVMLALALTWPRYFYPLVWGSIVMLLEPINIWLGRQNFLETLEQGNWKPVICLSLGALICGFFWEMWNYFAYPKWIYHTPGAQFFHIFEMPVLGYLGYLPFAWELFALRNFLWAGAPRLRL